MADSFAAAGTNDGAPAAGGASAGIQARGKGPESQTSGFFNCVGSTANGDGTTEKETTRQAASSGGFYIFLFFFYHRCYYRHY